MHGGRGLELVRSIPLQFIYKFTIQLIIMSWNCMDGTKKCMAGIKKAPKCFLYSLACYQASTLDKRSILCPDSGPVGQ